MGASVLASGVQKEGSRREWKGIRALCFRLKFDPDVGGWHDLHFGPNPEFLNVLEIRTSRLLPKL